MWRTDRDEAAPADLDELAVDCGAGAGRALERVREVLTAVIERADSAGAEWPGVEEWKRILPAWFVSACVDDAQLRDCVVDRWSLRAWVYWFQPERRKWRWWDADAGGGRLTVRVQVLERPYLKGALEWLLKTACAG